jgi:hypothetical protein
MPDSHPGTPTPSDNGLRPEKKKRPKRPVDDEAIDFDDESAADGGYHSGALSFKVSRSGPLSGSSVMPWSELIKDNDDVGRELFRQEANKDAELLRDALSQEPPPSPVQDAIVEEPLPEKLAAETADDDDDDFQLGLLPDMDDASSIFGRAVGLRSELSDHGWDPSSDDDLLGEGKLDHESPTDELRRPAVQREGQPRAEPAEQADAELDDPVIESSAVDLGSKPQTDVPSSFVRHAQDDSSFRRRNGAANEPSDHGPPDLLAAPSEIFDLAAAGLAANQLNLALDEKPPSRWKAWVGGGVCGLLVGAATYLAMWYSHPLPNVTASATSKPLSSSTLQDDHEQARTTWQAQTAGLLARADEAAERAQKAQAEYDSLTAKLKSAKIDTADLPGVAARLAREQEAIEESKRAHEAYTALAAAVKSANLDPNDVPSAVARLSQARASAEAATVQAEAQLARVRQDAAASARDAKAAEERLRAELDRQTTARAALADFQAAVVARLKVVGAINNESAAGDLIAALDAALQRQPGTLPKPNAATADREYGTGRALYRAGDYQAAEVAFDAAVKANERDARHFYFRGLARWQLGRTDEAGRDFARGAELERQSLPNPTEIDFALERVQGGPRQALNRYRP